jgi:PKHD-type hydroxylase
VILCVPEVLTAEELDQIRKALAGAPFVDGASTAGWSARTVKKNQQLTMGTEVQGRLQEIIRNAFHRNATLQAALLPKANTMALFNRYEVGMHYGAHVDQALMGHMGDAVRTDVAITIFISDPRSYAGGELCTNMHGMEYAFKLDAGAAIAYPANTLHEVKPVTHGARYAAVLWVQSHVRDDARRELLWDLDMAKRDIFGREGKSKAFDAISRSHANLLRMWAEV